MQQDFKQIFLWYTDKKESKIFLIYKEIQRDRVQSQTVYD